MNTKNTKSTASFKNRSKSINNKTSSSVTKTGVSNATKAKTTKTKKIVKKAKNKGIPTSGSLNTISRSNPSFGSEKNIDNIQREVYKSEELLNEQANLITRLEVLNRNSYQVEDALTRLYSKHQDDEFPETLHKYSAQISQLISAANQDSSQLEELKYLREENKTLKYKLDMISIDQCDSALVSENKLKNWKSLLQSEISETQNFLGNFGYNLELQSTSLMDESSIAYFFQNTRQLIKNLHSTIGERENEINLVSNKRQQIEKEASSLKDDKSNYEALNEIEYWKNKAKDYEQKFEKMSDCNYKGYSNEVPQSQISPKWNSNSILSFQRNRNQTIDPMNSTQHLEQKYAFNSQNSGENQKYGPYASSFGNTKFSNNEG